MVKVVLAIFTLEQNKAICQEDFFADLKSHFAYDHISVAFISQHSQWLLPLFCLPSLRSRRRSLFFPSAASWVLKQKSRPVAKNIQLICIDMLANSKYETFLVHCVLARMLRMYYRYSSFSIVVLRLEYTHLFLDVKACLLCLDMINHSDLRVVPT